MNAHLPKEFLEVARNVGHDLDLLKRGELIVSYLRLPTLDDVRRILSRANIEQRRRRGSTFFDHIRARQRLGQGRHDRGESFVFADGHPLPEDAAGLRNHLPIRLKAISVLDKTVEEGAEWDVSTFHSEWGLEEPEELYCLVNVGTLVLEKDARVVVRGNVFTLTCQKLICFPSHSPHQHYDFGILPTPFSFGAAGLREGRNGVPGLAGAPGRKALKPEITSTLCGPLALAAITPSSLNGCDGTDGTAGQCGGQGRNGGACKTAEINLRSIEGPEVHIFAQPGRGGDGGHGGRGGNGGDAGSGADGVRTVDGTLAGGDSGREGNGGDGGDGGRGGNGGISSNVYVVVPAGSANRIRCTALPGPGGEGGEGGKPGAPGAAGTPGRGTNGSSHGTSGVPGLPGRSGKAGPAGRNRPSPPIQVEEIP